MTDALLQRPDDGFRLVSVREAEAPPDGSGVQWHRYEIAQGPNSIVGYRQGSYESVTTAVEGIVFQLNERRLDRRGRVHIKLKSQAVAGGKAAS